jgi:GNAT superfamily N-acetyltransferase
VSVSARRVWGDLSCDVHAARLRYFAATGAAAVRRADGALAVVTGAPSNIENGVVGERDDVAPEAAEDLVTWVRGHDVPASWICESVEASSTLAEALGQLGCREETTGVDMGAELATVRGIGAEVAGLTLDEVDSAQALEAWLDVAQACGWFEGDDDREGQRRLYTAAGWGRDRPHRHWLARRGGQTVGLATAFFAGETALLENLAVVPAERRRGIGTALTMLRLREARRLGCRLAVLGPTPDGQPFYEQFNFTVTGSARRRWWYLP